MAKWTFALNLMLSGLVFRADASASSLPTSLSGRNVLNAENVRVDLEPSQGLVVVFLSAICPCSNSHIEELTKLAADFPQFKFVGVHSNLDEAQAPTREYFSRAHLPFSVIQDTGAQWAGKFRALKTPHAFVVNAKGELVYNGGVSDSHDLHHASHLYLREALKDLSQHHAVRTPQARTLGCAISRAGGGHDVW